MIQKQIATSMVTLQRADSATFSVNSVLKKGPASSNDAPRLSVQFNEESNEYFTVTRRTTQERKVCWYAKEDFKAFKANIRETVLRTAKQHQETKDNGKKSNFDAIKNMYLAARKIGFVMEDANELLTPKKRSQLASLYADEDMIDLTLGMEYWVHRSMKQDLVNQREACQEIVFDVQCEYQEGMWKSRQEMEKEMADSLLFATQASVLFAQALALVRLDHV